MDVLYSKVQVHTSKRQLFLLLMPAQSPVNCTLCKWKFATPEKLLEGKHFFLWACLNKVTVLLGLSSAWTLYPVSSLSRKPAAYRRSSVKGVLVSCITLGKKVWVPRSTSPAGVGCKWPGGHWQGQRINSCVQGKLCSAIDRKQRITNSFQTWSPKFLVSD